MGVTIKLQTCFALSGSDTEKITLPEGVKTVADLLRHMGEEVAFDLILACDYGTF